MMILMLMLIIVHRGPTVAQCARLGARQARRRLRGRGANLCRVAALDLLSRPRATDAKRNCCRRRPAADVGWPTFIPRAPGQIYRPRKITTTGRLAGWLGDIEQIGSHAGACEVGPLERASERAIDKLARVNLCALHGLWRTLCALACLRACVRRAKQSPTSVNGSRSRSRSRVAKSTATNCEQVP
ncbi:Hypothetical predicted protein [Olea europaea subsp. europaea]|uniref:Secreted protein n=1 Tax=Olea europaea subsp. europaea TaxID=158383 RepID=A0A8S0SG21_OLEEU|nr:Hypothetical predicted protein [Olea europaea subsp. europaea]